MKRITYLSLLLLISFQCAAINIRQIAISRISNEMVNISLNTEGEELYYFSSWRYEIVGTDIEVEACFSEGFGSTIAFLNNNFEIGLNTAETQTFFLTVKIYYDNFESRNLQDAHSGFFSTPIENPILLSSKFNEIIANEATKFVNPTSGKLSMNKSIQNVFVFDETGRFVGFFERMSNIIDISNLLNGLYYITYFIDGTFETTRIILDKK